MKLVILILLVHFFVHSAIVVRATTTSSAAGATAAIINRIVFGERGNVGSGIGCFALSLSRGGIGFGGVFGLRLLGLMLGYLLQLYFRL